MSKKLELEFMGGLTKFQAKTDAVRQFQVKTLCGDNDSEITEMVREIERWAQDHLVDELNDLQRVAPATAIAWSNLPLPLDDYGMYFDVDFGQDIYTGAHGQEFKAKLTAIKFSRKKGIREAVLTFVKNGDPEDDAFCRTFLNIKEVDENGKKKPVPMKIVLTECESFYVGNEADLVKEDDSDELAPLVFSN